MTKKTLKLIGDLNNIYDTIWNLWTQTENESFKFNDYSKKLKLILKIVKNIEEQDRGFLKSKVNYKKGGEYILNNFNSEYDILHKEVSNILLNYDENTVKTIKTGVI